MLAYRAGMRRTPRSTTLTALIIPLLVAACGVTLTGCGPAEPEPAPTPTASATHAPLFSTDEEALAAAEEAYRKYLEVSDQIAREGGVDPGRLQSLATDEQFEIEKSFFDGMRDAGTRLQGSVVLASVDLQAFDATAVTIYGCIDVSGARHVTSEGVDTTAPDRPDRVLLEVMLVVDDERLLVADVEPWSTSC